MTLRPDDIPARARSHMIDISTDPEHLPPRDKSGPHQGMGSTRVVNITPPHVRKASSPEQQISRCPSTLSWHCPLENHPSTQEAAPYGNEHAKKGQ